MIQKNKVLLIFLLISLSFSSLVFAQNNEKLDNKAIKDISKHWAEDKVRYLLKEGIVEGYHTEDGIYIKPEYEITRAEFLTVLLKATKFTESKPNNTKKFIDVDENAWYKNVIDIASSNGIAEGYPDGSFKPNNKITRAEIAALVVKANGWSNVQMEEVLNPFIDVNENDWFYFVVMMCKQKNMINGYPDNSFRPKNNALRGEGFVLIANILNVMTLQNEYVFVEEKDIPNENLKEKEIKKVDDNEKVDVVKEVSKEDKESNTKSINITDEVFNVLGYSFYYGKLSGLNDFTGYKVVLVDSKKDETVENVLSNGEFTIQGFDSGFLASFNGYVLNVIDPDGKVVLTINKN